MRRTIPGMLLAVVLPMCAVAVAGCGKPAPAPVPRPAPSVSGPPSAVPPVEVEQIETAAAPDAVQTPESPAKPSSQYQVILTGFGESKIQVIKVVREATGMGLKEAKDFVEGPPAILKSGLSQADAEKLQRTIEAAGGTAKIEGSTSGPVASATASPSADDLGNSDSQYRVVLTGFGDSKIQVIKVVREATGLGLKEAKDFVEGPPATLKSGLTRADAERLQRAIEQAGGAAKVEPVSEPSP